MEIKNLDNVDPTTLGADELLKAQHREVETLFHQIETASDRKGAHKEELVREIAAKLTAHAHIEEKVFYPAAQEIEESIVREAYEEHESMRFALMRALNARAKDPDFKAKITVLKEIVGHHVKEEETELLPKVRASMSNEAFQKLSEKVQQALETAQAEVEAEAAPKRAPAKRAAATKKKVKAGATVKAKTRTKAPAKAKAKTRAASKATKKTKTKARRTR